MIFEIGKTYQHDNGQKMTIIGRLTTYTYGECLIGETDKGNLVPVGESEGNAVYWHECMRESKQKPKEDILDKIRADIEQKCCITVGRENDPAITLYDVFQIIDKYKAESEG